MLHNAIRWLAMSVITLVIAGVTGLLFLAYLAANPSDYSGYRPGTAKYEAREFWLSIPEVIDGGEFTCEWSAFNPLKEESP